MKFCTCEICGKTFKEKDYRPGRFCGRKCYEASLPKKIEVVCQGCGKTIPDLLQSQSYRKFCRHDCYLRYAKKERHSCFQHGAESRVCATCGEELRVTGSEEERQFCSIECWRMYQKENPVNGIASCPQCGKSFRRNKAGQICCSDACANSYYTGTNSKGWGGGEYEDYVGFHHVFTGVRRKTGKSAGEVIYLRKHRLIVEKAIGRKLFGEERIWHIDRDRSNNELDNLYVFQSSREMMAAYSRRRLPTKSNIEVVKGEG